MSAWSVVPMIQWPGHGMMNTTRPGIRSVIPPCAGSRSRRMTMCEPRLGTNLSPPSSSANLASGSAAQTPVASMTRSARISNRSLADEVPDRRPDEPLAVEQRRSAWTRVAATAPPASAVRSTASASRASSSTPSW